MKLTLIQFLDLKKGRGEKKDSIPKYLFDRSELFQNLPQAYMVIFSI